MKSLRLLTVPVVLFIVALAVFAGQFVLRAESYHADIEEILSQKTKHVIHLTRPITAHFSLKNGIEFTTKDVIVDNPSWAQRPYLAKVRRLNLGIAFLPLLKGKIAIDHLMMAGADVEIETNAEGVRNFNGEVESDELLGNLLAQQPKDAQTSTVLFALKKFDFVAARFAKRASSGEISEYLIPKLTLIPTGKETKLYYEGSYKGKPTTMLLVAEGSIAQLLKGPLPFKLDAAYGNLQFLLQGSVDYKSSHASVSYYRITAGKTMLTGDVTISFDRPKPFIQGRIDSTLLDFSDLTPDVVALENNQPAPAQKKVEAQEQRVFSDAALPAELLSIIDARFLFSVDDVPLGSLTGHDLKGKVVLYDGKLIFSPFTIDLAGGKVQGQFLIGEASDGVQAFLFAKGREMEISQFLQLDGLASIIDGKSDIEAELTSHGKSMHELASHADGRVVVALNGGEINASEVKRYASAAFDFLVLPISNILTDPAIHCGYARFLIEKGAVRTSGGILDSSLATVLLRGAADLNSERLNFRLTTRGKVMGTASTIPAIRIEGSLQDPQFTSEGSALQKAANVLTGDVSVPADSIVPDVAAGKGALACVQALERPTYRSTIKSDYNEGSVMNNVIGQVKNFVGGNDIGAYIDKFKDSIMGFIQ